MLDTRFPRLPGDIGNPASWPFPVRYRVVPGASPERVVRRRAEGLLDGFIAAGRDLVAAGVDGIATTCGFLSPFQARLAEALAVPVAASALMQVPAVAALLPPGRRVGVLTVAAAALTREHLAAAGAPEDTPVMGTDGGGTFTRAILGDEPDLDAAAARRDVIEATGALAAAHPELGAIVLECTNMDPYAADVAAASGLPVFSMRSFLLWFQAGLRPRRFPSGERS